MSQRHWVVEVERALDHDRLGAPRRAVAWIPGTIQPFESLWMTAQRFAVLNRPSRLQLRDAVLAPAVGLDAADPTVESSTGANALFVPATRWHRFAELLGERPEAFRHSRLSETPSPMSELFDEQLRWCEACLRDGFHSTLFSLKGLTNCPAHRTPLATSCRCGRVAFQDGLEFSPRHPGRCSCGLHYLNAAAARRSASVPARDAALHELVKWLDSAGERVWFRVPGELTTHYEEFRRQLSHWEQTLKLQPAPSFWLRPPRKLRPGKDLRRVQIYRQGTLAASPRQDGSTQSTMRDDSSYGPVFKSMRRYAVRHVMANRRCWLTYFAQRADAEDALGALLASPAARPSWALLLWWQAGVGSVSLRDWFRPRAPRVVAPEELGAGSLTRNHGGGATREDLRATEWILHRLYVTRLLMLWAGAEMATQRAVKERRATWGYGVSCTRHAPVWSQAKDEQGRAILCVDSPTTNWIAASRVDRQERRASAKIAAQHRIDNVTAVTASPCLWYRSHDEAWSTKTGLMPVVALDCRRRHLMVDDPVDFVLIVDPELENAQDRFVGRCLSMPLAGSGRTPALAIKALKWAVGHYRRQCVAKGPRADAR